MAISGYHIMKQVNLSNLDASSSEGWEEVWAPLPLSDTKNQKQTK